METRAAAGWVDGRHFRYPVVRPVARTPHPRPAPPPPNDPANPLIPTTAPRSVCTTGGGFVRCEDAPTLSSPRPVRTSFSLAERQHPSTPHELAGLTFTVEDSQVRELGFSQAVSPSFPRAVLPRSHSLWQLSLKKVPSRVAHVRLARSFHNVHCLPRVGVACTSGGKGEGGEEGVHGLVLLHSPQPAGVRRSRVVVGKGGMMTGRTRITLKFEHKCHESHYSPHAPPGSLQQCSSPLSCFFLLPGARVSSLLPCYLNLGHLA